LDTVLSLSVSEQVVKRDALAAIREEPECCLLCPADSDEPVKGVQVRIFLQKVNEIALKQWAKREV
jgi:hypothetical protein